MYVYFHLFILKKIFTWKAGEPWSRENTLLPLWPHRGDAVRVGTATGRPLTHSPKKPLPWKYSPVNIFPTADGTREAVKPACLWSHTKQRKSAPPQREKIIFCSKLMFVIFVQVSCPSLYVKIEVEETRKAWDRELKKKRKIFQEDGWEYEM